MLLVIIEDKVKNFFRIIFIPSAWRKMYISLATPCSFGTYSYQTILSQFNSVHPSVWLLEDMIYLEGGKQLTSHNIFSNPISRLKMVMSEHSFWYLPLKFSIFTTDRNSDKSVKILHFYLTYYIIGFSFGAKYPVQFTAENRCWFGSYQYVRLAIYRTDLIRSFIYKLQNYLQIVKFSFYT